MAIESPDNRPKRVLFFATCLVDQFFPKSVRPQFICFEKADIEVIFPEGSPVVDFLISTMVSGERQEKLSKPNYIYLRATFRLSPPRVHAAGCSNAFYPHCSKTTRGRVKKRHKSPGG